MTTKAAFTDEEWQVLQWAVTDTIAYLSIADAGFWDTFKESTAAAKFIAGVEAANPDPLVHDLAAHVRARRDKSVTGAPADVAAHVTERVGSAAQLVAQKAPDDLDAFKGFILGIAKATAEAAKGVGPAETEAIEKIRAALG